MQDSKIAELVRVAGYEALFLLAEASLLAMKPTLRNAERLQMVFAELRERRGVRKFLERGLAESGKFGQLDALRLTDLGQIAFHGGRDPEERWEREWDGQWRLICFDLPRKERGPRLRFWRWLRANHFGNLQGSLWISPDPVPVLQQAAKRAGFDPAAVVVFTGNATGNLTPREMAERSWDFAAINGNFDRYRTFAQETLTNVRKNRVSRDSLREALTEDRKLWWKALRLDPLLPRTLHPRRYGCPAALKLRRQLHHALFRNLDLPAKT